MLNSLFYVHQKRQEERTGKYGTPRLHYQQELVSQFQNATSEESKEKIVANLANFTYYPFNYTFLHQLNILELFLDCIMEPNEKIIQQILLLSLSVVGFPLIIQFSSSPVRNTVNYALGIMYNLCNASNKGKILKPEVVDVIRRYAAAESVGVRFSNLAHALLDKHVYELE
ncbi:hypothetical protein ACSBR2_035936 [Camellia fascicularis]